MILVATSNKIDLISLKLLCFVAFQSILSFFVAAEDICSLDTQTCGKMATRERTFLAIKPDAVQRGLVGDIIKRFEQRGYKLVALKMIVPSEKLLQQHYAELANKPFFTGSLKFHSVCK